MFYGDTHIKYTTLGVFGVVGWGWGWGWRWSWSLYYKAKDEAYMFIKLFGELDGVEEAY